MRLHLTLLFAMLFSFCPCGIGCANDCPTLDPPTAKSRIETLSDDIRYHNRLYYQELRPVLSDAEYDRLFAELVRLEGCFPALVQDGSPSRRVGSSEVDPKLSLPHETPMLSLDSSADETAVANLLQRIENAGAVPRLLVQPKFDGLPLELGYVNGRLSTAATRGDGERGEEVTAQARRIPGIPQQLHKDAPSRLVVRGELYARKGKPTELSAYATLRHQAMATLRNRNATRAELGRLAFFPYERVDNGPQREESDLATLERLRAWGFPDPLPETRVVKSLAEIRTLFAAIQTHRSEQPFASDGIVVKVDALPLRRALGTGSRAPLWAAAWKFPAAEALTTVEAIDWQVGRTGKRTPVARLAPVEINGITVSRVTLHNRAEIERLDIAPGDEVRVALSGDVIPQIAAVTRRVARPALPPQAEQAAPGGVACYRNSEGCSEQFLARAVHFASPAGLNIAGLGKGRLQKLIAAGRVDDLPTLLTLNEAEIIVIDGFGEATAEKLAAALAAARHPQPFRLLASLGLDGLGPAALDRLQANYASLGALVSASEAQLTPIVGAKPATALLRFFADPEGRRQLAAFHRLGLCGDDPQLVAWLETRQH